MLNLKREIFAAAERTFRFAGLNASFENTRTFRFADYKIIKRQIFYSYHTTLESLIQLTNDGYLFRIDSRSSGHSVLTGTAIISAG